MELGIWSVGKSKGVSYTDYASRFDNLNSDYLTIFAVHPARSGGLTVRNPEHVANEVEAIQSTGKSVRLSFWFGTDRKYVRGFADALFALEKVLEKRGVDPSTIIKELDAEYHATAPGIKQAKDAVKYFKQILPAFKYKNQFTITCLWWISPCIQELVYGLSDYIVGVTPQLYSFYKPEAKKDSALEIMRPMKIQNKGLEIFNNKIVNKRNIRSAYSNKQGGVHYNHAKAYDRVSDLLIVGLANYYQKHPNYKMSDGKYNITKALDDAFNSCYTHGVEKFCYFSLEWCYGSGNSLASKYERDSAKNFISNLKRKNGTFWQKICKPAKQKETNTMQNSEEITNLDGITDKQRTIIIQTLLSGLGYNIGVSGKDNNGVDGIRGSLTVEAIKSAERMLNINSDGIPDDALIESLNIMYERVYNKLLDYEKM